MQLQDRDEYIKEVQKLSKSERATSTASLNLLREDAPSI